MPTGKQIRAARGLTDWVVAELAEKIGMRRETVESVERGDTIPRPETMEKIVNAFNEAGIEFIGDKGVIQKDDDLIRLTGDNVFFKVLDDVTATCRSLKGVRKEALFACVVDRLSPPLVVENYRRLRAEGTKMRSLVKEGDDYLMGAVEEYRTLPSRFFHNNPMVIYGDKVAFMILNADTKTDKMAIIMSNPHTSAAMRNLFEFIWQHSEPPKHTSAEERYE